MKLIDIIFALVTGRVIGYLVGDFLKEWDITLNIYYSFLLWIALPFFSLFCLWLACLIGKKLLFVFQAAKYFLVGAFTTVVDLKLFELLLFLFGAIAPPVSILLAKGLSFLFSTSLKYWGNKYWVFQKHQKENFALEIIQFFAITLVGLVIDVIAFYYFTKMTAPHEILEPVWVKLSVLLAAVVAAIWNFLGYKFLVFKK